MIVLKIGGSCLKSVDDIMECANYIATRQDESIAIVVSAMGKQTTELATMAKKICYVEPSEMDVVCSVGEQITVSLLSMALKKIDINAKSYLAWQLPIYTDNKHGEASIRYIETRSIKKDIERNIIPIIAGYQGMTVEGRLTTLGREGSDLTAVALSCALEAKKCELFKDVNGIYNKDPHLYEDATIYTHLNYNKMLLILKSQESKIIHKSAILMAQKYNQIIHVRPYLKEGNGTIIGEKHS